MAHLLTLGFALVINNYVIVGFCYNIFLSRSDYKAGRYSLPLAAWQADCNKINMPVDIGFEHQIPFINCLVDR